MSMVPVHMSKYFYKVSLVETTYIYLDVENTYRIYVMLNTRNTIQFDKWRKIIR